MRPFNQRLAASRPGKGEGGTYAPRWRVSQRTLILGLVLAAVAVAALLNTRTVQEAGQLAAASAKRELAAQARLAAVAHDRWLEEMRSALLALGTALKHEPALRDRCEPMFAEFVAKANGLDTVLLVSPAGDLLCSSIPVNRQVNFSDRRYFKNAMETRRFAIGDFITGRVSGQRVLPIALPVLNDGDGAVAFLLVAGKQLDWLGDVVIQQVQGQTLELTVVDANGIVVARAPGGEYRELPMPEADVIAAVRHSREAGIDDGFVESVDLNGVPRYYAYTRLSRAGDVHAVVSRVAAESLAAVNAFRDRSYWQLALGAVLLVALLWVFLGRMILVPLEQLAVGMRRVREGNLSWRSRVGAGTREIANMSESFNAMVEKLEAATDQLQELATTDPLMRIANRRRFTEQLEREWRREGRSHLPLSMVMIDVDHFKAYNDAYGHTAGDDCLRRIAAIITESCKRPGDLVARYGGEEIVILLPETDAAGAAGVAEHARRNVFAAAMPHAHSAAGEVVTVSLGVATVDQTEGKRPADLFTAADEALYRAKRLGRNRVEKAAPDG